MITERARHFLCLDRARNHLGGDCRTATFVKPGDEQRIIDVAMD